MGIFQRVLRAGEGRKLKALASLVPDITDLEPEMQALSDDGLRAKTGEFRQRLDQGETLDDLLIEAFAVVREAASRTIGQRHFDVQLMGGAALHFGWVAEMKTGEGKTLVSTLPVYLNGLSGQGLHVITVNDYLASRDAEWMGQIHRFLGLSVGLVIPGEYDFDKKKAAYGADITYGTNNEFGFDYLRDNMAMSRPQQVQRGHVYAIVDEIDSILIDEARTPLIISGRVADAAKIYYQFADIARQLQRDVDYEVDEEKRTVAPLESGIEKVEKILGLDNLYDSVSSNLVHQLTVALKAKELFKNDKDYIVTDGEVKIVDEFTGRILEGRRWSEGLHQAVEAKERVKIKEENQTLATVTLQNYFRQYDKLAGMTGTAQTEASELAHTYHLDVVQIPTNMPVVRVDQPDLVYKSMDAKFDAVADDITDRSRAGQPVLVGTASVENSERLSNVLTKRGIAHEVLNAKQHTREAEIVAQAGRPGAVTVATNMAGRGVDIILGGNPEALAAREVRAMGLDPDDDGEGAGAYADKLSRYQAECRADHEKVIEAGGLYVLGTERHDSRRIDNQLRGRSGRQGDPGESRFYLSLDDDLMRLFATGAVSWVMNKSLPDDVPIESKMVSKAVERAQTTVEQRNAEIRKNVLEYDEVFNEQRKVVYKRRDQILDGQDLRDQAMESLSDAIESTVATYCVADYSEEWDLEGLVAELGTFWPSPPSIDDLSGLDSVDDVYQASYDAAEAYYSRREQEIGETLMRDIERQVMLRILDQKWREHLYEMDYLREGIGLRAMGQKDPLVEWQREGFDMFEQMMHGVAQDFVRYVMHLEVRQPEPAPAVGADLKGAFGSEADGEEGPDEEQPAAAPTDADDATPEPAVAVDRGPALSGVSYSAPEDPTSGSVTRPGGADQAAAAVAGFGRQPQEAKVSRTVVKDEHEKLGRNDPCWCDSGKKYKHCHGR